MLVAFPATAVANQAFAVAAASDSICPSCTDNNFNVFDVAGGEVDRDFLIPMSTALYAYGFNYMQCQCAYDQDPGQYLVSVYHLAKLTD